MGVDPLSGRPLKHLKGKTNMTNKLIYCFALILSTCVISPAHAGACTKQAPCGEVTNNSAWVLQYTANLNSKGSIHLCDVWNWNRGFGGPWERFKEVMCTQQTLGQNLHMGGGNADVDAFTFNDRSYLLDFHGKLSWRKKGIWTQIRNNEGATCVTSSEYNLPVCTVYWD